MIKIKDLVNSLTESVNYSLDDGLIFWQERVLNRILFFAAIFGFPVLIPSFILSLSEGLYLIAGVDFAIYFAVITLLILKKISYYLRASVFVVFSYVLGIVLLYILGASGGGPVWLFFAPIIAVILLGFRAGVISLILNALISIAVGIFIYQAMSDITEASPFLSSWIVISLNFMLLNILSTVSIPSIFQGLQNSTEAQKASKQKYTRIFENIMDVYFETSLIGTILEMTPSGADFFEIEYSKLIGNTFKSLNFSDISLFLASLKEKGVVENFESSFTSFKGHRKSCSINARLNDDNANRVPTIVGVLRDVTQLHVMSEEKQKLEERLLQSEKMESIGLLAGGVAHDLNNILSAIVAYPEMMLPDIPENHPHHEYLLAMKGSGEKAAAILDDLLNLARRGIIIREVVDLNRIISDFLDSPECRNLQVLHPYVEIDVALAAAPTFISGSKLHLHKMLLNLFLNALEATSEAGTVTISTRILRAYESLSVSNPIPLDDYIILKVEDTGIGIPPSDILRIFEPFFTRKIMGRSGTGLGMAVVWGTIQDHKGFIEIESEVGSGTSIEVFLPLSAKMQIGVESKWAAQDYQGGGETILVVDDLAQQRDINAMLLENLNYKVLTTESGEEALGIIRRKDIEIVLMDMVMDPGMSGIETYLEMKKIKPDQKVILISGYAEDLKVEEALNLGIRDFLKKPCTLKVLSKSIRTVLTSEPVK